MADENRMAKEILAILGVNADDEKLVDNVIPDTVFGNGRVRITPHYRLTRTPVSVHCEYKKVEAPLDEPKVGIELLRGDITDAKVTSMCSGCKGDCELIKERYAKQIENILGGYGLEPGQAYQNSRGNIHVFGTVFS